MPHEIELKVVASYFEGIAAAILIPFSLYAANRGVASFEYKDVAFQILLPIFAFGSLKSFYLSFAAISIDESSLVIRKIFKPAKVVPIELIRIEETTKYFFSLDWSEQTWRRDVFVRPDIVGRSHLKTFIATVPPIVVAVAITLASAAYDDFWNTYGFNILGLGIGICTLLWPISQVSKTDGWISEVSYMVIADERSRQVLLAFAKSD